MAGYLTRRRACARPQVRCAACRHPERISNWQSGRPALRKLDRSPDREGSAMTAAPDDKPRAVDLEEAARQLQQAAHDVRVAFDCIALDELDRAHTHAITARAAVDAAEYALRVALGGEWSIAER